MTAYTVEQIVAILFRDPDRITKDFSPLAEPRNKAVASAAFLRASGNQVSPERSLRRAAEELLSIGIPEKLVQQHLVNSNSIYRLALDNAAALHCIDIGFDVAASLIDDSDSFLGVNFRSNVRDDEALLKEAVSEARLAFTDLLTEASKERPELLIGSAPHPAVNSATSPATAPSSSLEPSMRTSGKPPRAPFPPPPKPGHPPLRRDL